MASCKERVLVLDLQKFCAQVHHHISSTWPWVLFGESLHRLLHGFLNNDGYISKCFVQQHESHRNMLCRLLDHLWEMILLNNCCGLAKDNEQAYEGVHKVKYTGTGTGCPSLKNTRSSISDIRRSMGT